MLTTEANSEIGPELLALPEQEVVDAPGQPSLSYVVRVSESAEPITVVSCPDVLALPLSSDLHIDPDDELSIQAFWSQAVVCKAQHLVSTAKLSKQSRVAEVLSSKEPTRALPPQLGLVDFTGDRSRAERAAAECRSWGAYDQTLTLKARSSHGFSVQADIWSATVVFYARGDFDGDGFEDLLVRRDGHADEGSYGATALFLLSRDADDSCVRVARAWGRS